MPNMMYLCNSNLISAQYCNKNSTKLEGGQYASIWWLMEEELVPSPDGGMAAAWEWRMRATDEINVISLIACETEQVPRYLSLGLHKKSNLPA